MLGQKLIYRDLGHFVRSEWEANYCRILRHLGIRYGYEAQTFRLPSGRTYTPDIKIRDDLFVEIKGRIDDVWLSIKQEFNQTYPQISLVVVDTKHYNALLTHYFFVPRGGKRVKQPSKDSGNNGKPRLKFIGTVSTTGDKIIVIIPKVLHEQARQLRGKQVKVVIEEAIT